MSQPNPGDSFSALFDTAFPKSKKPEKAPIWEAKQFEGRRYVSLEQVIELLEMNDVLPAVQEGLRRRIKPDGS